MSISILLTPICQHKSKQNVNKGKVYTTEKNNQHCMSITFWQTTVKYILSTDNHHESSFYLITSAWNS